MFRVILTLSSSENMTINSYVNIIIKCLFELKVIFLPEDGIKMTQNIVIKIELSS